MRNPLQNMGVSLTVIGTGGVCRATRSLDITRTREVQDMPDNVGNIGSVESASNTKPQDDTWQPIGAVIARQIAHEVARRVREKQAEGGK